MRRSEIPSLDDLRAFETIARLGSIRAAAEELALTQGAVSRRAANLAAALIRVRIAIKRSADVSVVASCIAGRYRDLHAAKPPLAENLAHDRCAFW